MILLSVFLQKIFYFLFRHLCKGKINLELTKENVIQREERSSRDTLY